MEGRRTGMGLNDAARNTPGASQPLELLKEKFPDGILETSSPQGDATALIGPEYLVQSRVE